MSILDTEKHYNDSDHVQICYSELGDLQGQLLTYVDATFIDEKQREAHKSIVKRVTKDWMNNLYHTQMPKYYDAGGWPIKSEARK